MQALALDPHQARPLTSREIAKLFCGVIGSLCTSDDPPSRAVISEVLRATVSSAYDLVGSSGKPLLPFNLRHLDDLAEGEAPHVCSTWAAAIGATVISLRGWCDPGAVRTAVTWVVANIDAIWMGDERADVSAAN